MLKSRLTNKTNLDKVLAKIQRLLGDGRHTCLCVQKDQIRHEGSRMKEVELSDETLSYSYNGKKYELKLDDIYMTRRLRTRRYLLCFKADKSMGSGAHKHSTELREDSKKAQAEMKKKQDADQKAKDDKLKKDKEAANKKELDAIKKREAAKKGKKDEEKAEPRKKAKKKTTKKQ